MDPTATIPDRMPPDQFLAFMTGFTDRYMRGLRFLSSGRPASGGTAADLRLRVESRTVEAEDVVSLRLARTHGGPLPAWQPGCHLDVVLPSGLRRQYSLCGDPADRSSYRIAVRRLPSGGGGSVEIHQLQPGSMLTVRGPRNAFPFVAAESVLLVAGGIGITPMLSMAWEAARRGLDWRMVYAGRSRDSMPFLAELENLDATRVFVRPDDEYGLPVADDVLKSAVAGGSIYCCGPAPLLSLVRAGFADTGARQLHFERFAAPPVIDGQPLEVELRRSGQVVSVPADRSVLAAIRDVRPAVAYSCQQGFCGTCKVKVLSGAIDHRDRRLTDAQRAAGEMLICVSRGENLVVDL
ncbi:PDR/VanB family oxidoreductase [Fodinicola feengrottensis]|uniref:PDR/VanB family oxidoreductase n=1 Tax=Fodinicola feengrottensis TaxID=435914 RepID=A0ABP4S020_9ACTN|nr:PDR/VanB family oxidoreductase [Fodinicola feengrottensis]